MTGAEVSAECPLFTKVTMYGSGDPIASVALLGKTVCEECPVNGQPVVGIGRDPDEAARDLNMRVKRTREEIGCRVKIQLAKQSSPPAPQGRDSR